MGAQKGSMAPKKGNTAGERGTSEGIRATRRDKRATRRSAVLKTSRMSTVIHDVKVTTVNFYYDIYV